MLWLFFFSFMTHHHLHHFASLWHHTFRLPRKYRHSSVGKVVQWPFSFDLVCFVFCNVVMSIFCPKRAVISKSEQQPHVGSKPLVSFQLILRHHRNEILQAFYIPLWWRPPESFIARVLQVLVRRPFEDPGGIWWHHDFVGVVVISCGDPGNVFPVWSLHCMKILKTPWVRGACINALA